MRLHRRLLFVPCSSEEALRCLGLGKVPRNCRGSIQYAIPSLPPRDPVVNLPMKALCRWEGAWVVGIYRINLDASVGMRRPFFLLSFIYFCSISPIISFLAEILCVIWSVSSKMPKDQVVTGGGDQWVKMFCKVFTGCRPKSRLAYSHFHLGKRVFGFIPCISEFRGINQSSQKATTERSCKPKRYRVGGWVDPFPPIAPSLRYLFSKVALELWSSVAW